MDNREPSDLQNMLIHSIKQHGTLIIARAITGARIGASTRIISGALVSAGSSTGVQLTVRQGAAVGGKGA